MKKLWSKGGETLHPAVNQYMVSRTLAADAAILPFDVAASTAHVRMLATVGLITNAERDQLVAALAEVLALHEREAFVLTPEQEDVHTAIESFLSEKLGALGRKVHVGRSRNDQVLVALRLYVLSELEGTMAEILSTAEKILAFARKHEFVPMPGFTHMQHAMPSSVGQWSGAFVEALLNDGEVLKSVRAQHDQNPLGAAAGFGTGVPIDREETTRELGLKKVQVNPIFCQISRAKFDALTLAALSQVMMTLGRIANDAIIFTSQEFGFFAVDRALTTGSSIMPQKQNLDIMEVLRANVAIVASLQLRVQMAAHNLLSGYNKDVKIDKEALLEGFRITRDSLVVAGLLFEHLTPNEERLLAAFKDAEIFAADQANRLVMSGMPFRDAYRKVGEELSTLKPEDPVTNIRSKKHLGATGNLGLERYEAAISELKHPRS